MDWVEDAALGTWLTALLPACHDLYLASPYITNGGLQPLLKELRRPRRRLSVTILTCLDPMAVLTGALDLEALATLLSLSCDSHPVCLIHVPGLHAKVFIVDERAAVVGSGNLTRSGTQGLNVELGVRVTARADVRAVTQKFQHWSAGRPPLTVGDLDRFGRLVENNFGGIRRALSALTWGRLEVFPGAEGTDDDYFYAMISVLALGGGRGCSSETITDALKKLAQGQAGSQTAQARLLFLEFLGLMDQREDGRLYTTALGKSLNRSTGARRFAGLLMQEFPLVRRTLLALCDAHPDYLTYPQIAAALSDDTIRAEDATEEVKDGVRWLRSLGLVQEAAGRTSQNRKLFRATALGIKEGK